MQSVLVLRIAVVSVFTALALLSCSSPPPAAPVSVKERLRRDSVVVSQVIEKFELQLKFKNSKNEIYFLQQIAESIAQATPELADTPIKVRIIEDSSRRWRSYGIVGNRLYISRGALKKLQYENQVAAIMAIEFAHILNRHLISHLEAKAPSELTPLKGTSKIDFFGENGVFVLTEEEFLKSLKSANDILYRAGYEVRGLISIFEIFKSFKDHSPISPSLNIKLLEAVRENNASLPPLKNPTINSEQFLKFKSKINEE
jgi:hypothetical protein